MAIQQINLGSAANDGTGDDLRVAFAKVNNNFAELNDRQVDNTLATNIGDTDAIGIFASKDGDTLQFKKIKAGNNVTLSTTADTVTVNTNDSISSLTLPTDTGTLTINSNGTYSILGGQNIQTSVQGNDISIRITGTDLLLQDPAPKLLANLDANLKNINNATTVTANSFVGDLTGLEYGIDVRSLDTLVAGSDFGAITPTATSLVDILTVFTDVDYGTYSAPVSLTSDFGSFA